MNSLRGRLLVAAAVILAAFGSLAGLILERAFIGGLLQAQQDKLQTLVYSLLGAASTNAAGGLTIALDAVPDPRLRQPLSGLEAALLDENGAIAWSSSDSLRLTPPQLPQVGEWRFDRRDDLHAFSLSFGLRWIDASDDPRRYTVVVLEDATAFDRQVGVFRRTLWGWLGATLIALTLMLLVLLRWGLAPLRRLAYELQQIERGEQTQITGQYPDELQPLTRDLNAMIVNERNQQTRYRNALGDLAHTLKTPLAVLRGLTAEAHLDPVHRRQIHEQVDRMQHIVDHQLRRAAAVGTRTLTEPVALRGLADKLLSAIAKVYADKNLQIENQIPETLRVRADQGDLYDLIGNLLDNAAKYGHTRVRISALNAHRQCLIVVEDDGEGFPPDADRLLRRGARADTRVPGQGLGLAAVDEIVQAYGGQLHLERSELGGGKVVVVLPVH
ncbi:two-component system, OmpR family, sensor histidine kinase PhoQ [Fontimonas thermophila]|uniref:histidine kinase n=1 Tax=Fontimonas thermophila TaxID=1076937 RepID=A0A1I2HV13_9GAMM|nr:ATP-binding protein [Fontimonas thermophila]SFF33200.1 two-component system, OmpR family, sensor histidine kinase PhoQ [Fontimonas thermophila]